jgi:hypothetical protein
MIRVAWLQARVQILVAAGALAIVAVVVLVTGPHLHHLYDVNVAHCAARGDCDLAQAAFLKNDKNLYSWLGGLALFVPGVIGIFWGPPLIARELETGTFRLAWTQSVTRTRWFACKLAVVGLSAMAVAGVLSLMISWWASPLDTVRADRFTAPLFDERGIVMIGYAAFAFMLGVTAGMVIRRTVPAMATTLAAFVAAKLVVIQLIRPTFMSPTARSLALDPSSVGFGRRNSGPIFLQPDSPRIPGAWIRSVHVVDKVGHALTPTELARICPRLGNLLDAPPVGGSARHVRVAAPEGVKSTIQQCVAKVGTTYHEVVTYQPGKHYWPFQMYELALFVGAALVLVGFCFWWLRRRLT